ncbi:lanthionine synthetase C family protein [Paenibacillus alvei]|uniref:lanthionine synthetase C family protein n=1 Tax=Paenibacillus alvei TaxID=44250 RepID=UPI0013DC2B42|nr:lanthionine synthetase C family protein [Paenibacillus alvei]NEZ43386.1 lantibiotic modifying enzyme [Paenibacillus alvei]
MITTDNATTQYDRILHMIRLISEKLADPDLVKSICTSEKNRIEHQNDFIWDEISLASGYPSASILYGRLGTIFPRDEDQFNRGAHHFLLKTQEAMRNAEGVSLSLWSGLSGIGFAAYLLSNDGKKYRKLINQINELLVRYGHIHLQKAKENIRTGVYFQDYDVISGWSGIGRYLLLFSDIPDVRGLLNDVLEYLILLSNDKMEKGCSIPGWYIPAEHLPSHQQEIYAKGYFNLGLAHGIPGPLALLAIAYNQNIRVSGQKEAIEQYSKWILNWKIESDFGVQWPLVVSYGEVNLHEDDNQKNREAWCYGSPGVARSLWLAGKALGDISLQTLATDAFIAIFKKPIENWSIYSPSICHGYAGLLKLTHQMYLDTGNTELFTCYRNLLEDILGKFDPSSAFGFQDVYRDSKTTKYLDYLGILDGVTGIAMTLLDAIAPQKTKDWGMCLLIK